jgi:NAD(P)-dependent dehydrogenase (short-subunit alcohol dehydrogenase family)
MPNLSGKTALVTGASRGILALAAAGAPFWTLPDHPPDQVFHESIGG